MKTTFCIVSLAIAGTFPTAHADPFPYDRHTSHSLPDFLERQEIPLLDPHNTMRFGKVTVTTYTNARPTASLSFGKNTKLSVKASRSGALLTLKIPLP